MQGVMIYDTADFELVSFGNGFAYEFREKAGDPDSNLWLQGDDASAFRQELEDMEQAQPDQQRHPARALEHVQLRQPRRARSLGAASDHWAWHLNDFASRTRRRTSGKPGRQRHDHHHDMRASGHATCRAGPCALTPETLRLSETTLPPVERRGSFVLAHTIIPQ